MISIIIPIYNAGDKLNRMLSSLAKQSYINYEILLIDDGSTDQTAEICRQANCSDKRINYYFQENAGVSSARNLGLEKAKGEFVTFLDADDEIDNNYLQVLVEACKDADIAVCDVVCEDENGKELNRFTLPKQILTQRDALDYILQRRGINSGPCAKIFKKEVIDSIQFPMLKAYEDILFVVKVFYNAARVAVVNSTAYHYIQNDKGAMSTFLKTPSYDIIVATEQLVQTILKDNRLNDKCLYITLSHLYQYVLPLLKDEDIDRHKSFIADVQNVFKKTYKHIIKNNAFPWKEKLLYGLFCIGWSYQGRKFRKVVR